MATEDVDLDVFSPHITAHIAHSTLRVDEADCTSRHVAQASRRRTQKYSPAPKVYGDVLASGDSRVQLGDIYIYNIGTSRSHCVLPTSPIPYGRNLGLGNRSLIVATKTYRAQRSLLSWLLRITHEQLDIMLGHEAESHQFFRIDVLEKWRLYLGIGIGRTLGIRIYPPRIHNIVSDSAPIMLSSRNGDVITIRDLLLNNQASVTDITTENLSPLFHAIDNGHSHIVKELLNAGADPNQVIGQRQTSPLQWAVRQRNEPMIRLLIGYGANLHHVSHLGRSVLSHLWISEEEVRPTCIDLMHLLRTADPAEFRRSHQILIDVYGFSTINRVACMGTHDELELLLQDGAETKSVIELDWDAMFNATHQGELQNIKVLSPHFPDFAQRCDLRGWTLLHVAAGEGHRDIMKYLLENGADWQAKSWPAYDYIHENLKGKICTPAQVAAQESLEREQLFLETVEEVLGRSEDTSVEKEDLANPLGCQDTT